MKATAKDLRIHARELLDAVARGDSVTITLRGKPCAKLIPYYETAQNSGQRQTSELFGMWRDRDDMADVDAIVRNLRKSRIEN